MADSYGICDYCGEDCDDSSDANALSCTYARCEGGVYHQECLYQFLRANKLEKNRKTGFKCPRGCGKGTRHSAPCPGRIDKSHPYIPRNEEKFKKRQAVASEPTAKPTKPDKEKIRQQKAEEEVLQKAAKVREEAKKAIALANQPVPARALASQLGAKPPKPDKGIDLQQAALLKEKALKELNAKQGGGAAHGTGTPGRERGEPSTAVNAQRVSSGGLAPVGPAAWGARGTSANGAVSQLMHDTDALAPAPSAAITLAAFIVPDKRSKASQAKASAAAAAVAPPAVTTVHHGHTHSNGSGSSGGGAVGQEPPELTNLAEFPPVASAPPPPPPPAAGRVSKDWPCPASTVPTAASAGPPLPTHRHRLSDSSAPGHLPASALASVSAPAAVAVPSLPAAPPPTHPEVPSPPEPEDEEDSAELLAAAAAAGKGLTKTQKKNLKRQEKKKRQGSMALVDMEVMSDGASLHSDADGLTSGHSANQLNTPAPTKAAAGLPEAAVQSSSPTSQPANADHLLQETSTASLSEPSSQQKHPQQQQQQSPTAAQQDSPQQQDSQQQQQLPLQSQHTLPLPPHVTSMFGGDDAALQDLLGLEHLQQQQPTAPPYLSGARDTFLEDLCVAALVSRKCQRLYQELHRLGYAAWQAAAAVQACGATADLALTWLLEHQPCNAQQLSAAAAAGALPDVDVSRELSALSQCQQLLQLPADVLYKAVIDCSGDIHAATTTLYTTFSLHSLSGRSPSPISLLPSMHSLDTYHSAQETFGTLSRAATGRSDLQHWGSMLDAEVLLMETSTSLARGVMQTQGTLGEDGLSGQTTPFEGKSGSAWASQEGWRSGVINNGRWSIDAPLLHAAGQNGPRRSMEEMLAGNGQVGGGNGTMQHGGAHRRDIGSIWGGENGVVANGHSPHANNSTGGVTSGAGVRAGVHGSTGAAWESHGSASNDGRVRAVMDTGRQGHGSQADASDEVSAMMALMCR